jgi:predicted acyltransferase
LINNNYINFFYFYLLLFGLLIFSTRLPTLLQTFTMSNAQRFYSLDVFRGATVCLMILVNNPGTWSHIYGPLQHASWHGCTPTDLVFPFFLFAVGNAMAYVMPRLEAAGASIFWQKIIKRTLLIFLIGLLLNWPALVHLATSLCHSLVQ